MIFGGNRMNKNVKMGVYTRNGEEFPFNFYTALRVSDKVKFVNSVTSQVVSDTYNAVIRDLMFQYAIVDIFTDVDIAYIQTSDSPLELIEELLEETNIVDIVVDNAAVGLIAELNKAVDDNIEYLTGIHRNPINEGLGRLLDTVERKIADMDMSELMKAAQVINGIQGEFTMDKMLESYSKSDMFKEKYDQMLAERAAHDAEMEATGTAIRVVKTGSKVTQPKK